MALFALNIFPNLVYSLPNPENSLNIYNAASSPKTLGIMLVIACIGVPMVAYRLHRLHLLDFSRQGEKSGHSANFL
jgi:cytochrome bd-type quinol oxidase subunit 2